MQMGLAAGPPGEAPRLLEPAGTRLSRSESACSMPSAIASALVGSARTAASPQDSSSDGWDEATTGVPHAIASTTGIPKPSKSDGYANTLAPR